MTKLLYVQASPRRESSTSIRLADAYLSEIRTVNPDLEVDTIELWHEDLPAFDGDKAAAKMNLIGGQELAGAQKTAWDEVVAIANRFIVADRYLFAVPMWNGGIPYRMKQYIDLIHQPGLLWGLDPTTGYTGLLKGKQATLVMTAGAYGPPAYPSPAFGEDHQSTYLRAWLNQAGIVDIDEIRFQPTLLTAEPEADAQKAEERAMALAHRHGVLGGASVAA
jgi:FMN-dependent NADH-azoreductase